LAIRGDEIVDIALPSSEVEIIPRQNLELRITRPDGTVQTARVESRIDTENEIEYFRCGGILQFVLNNLVAGETRST
jgi:aconitate hydratase